MLNVDSNECTIQSQVDSGTAKSLIGWICCLAALVFVAYISLYVLKVGGERRVSQQQRLVSVRRSVVMHHVVYMSAVCIFAILHVATLVVFPDKICMDPPNRLLSMGVVCSMSE